MPRLSREHLEARRHGIGSSDIIAIAGLSPYEGHNAWSVWLDKRGLAEERATTLEQEAGHLVEEHVIPALYTRETGYSLGPSGLAQHREHRWMLASFDHQVVAPWSGAARPDARPGDLVQASELGHYPRRTVECKLVGIGMMRDWDAGADDGIPHYVRAQVAWQTACTGDDDEDVAVLLGGTRFRIFRVERDAELERQLIAIGERWWRRYIVEGAEPPIDETPECRAWIARKWPKVEHPELEAMPNVVEAFAARYRAAHRELTAATQQKEHCGNELRSLVADRAGFQGEHYKVTYLAARDGKRVLRVTGKGEE